MRTIPCLAVLALLSGLLPAQKLKWTGRVQFGPEWDGVPEYYRNLPYPEIDIPPSLEAWQTKRTEIRAVLHGLLGTVPPRPERAAARMLSREQRDGHTVEKIEIDNGLDGVIPAYVVVPGNVRKPAPAILLLHWHSGNKEGPLFSREVQNVAAPLLERGFVLMAIDCYFNGERLGHGPAGKAESNIEDQRDSLFKLNLWFGRTLWGMMVRDNQVAIDYLASRPDVDKGRIGASGMSMGSTGAWWLAALDDRVKTVVAVACFTRYRELIAAGQLRAHATYFFVPGMLEHFDTEAVLGLIAPRPLLALTGDSDPTSPPASIRVLATKLDRIYGLYNARDRFRSIVYPDTDHTYTPGMKREMASWFEKWLK